MIRHDRLEVDRAMVLVIDVQTKLLPLIRGQVWDGPPGPSLVVAAICKLLDGAAVFGVPVLATEQYPKGIGPTEASIAERLRRARAPMLEKAAFSACDEEPLRVALRAIDRPQVIVAGIECHVCVQQTVLDLLAMDYDVFVCADATGSRGAMDYERALQRMAHKGAAVTTVESVLFELCHRCDTAAFKAMIEVIKASPPVE